MIKINSNDYYFGKGIYKLTSEFREIVLAGRVKVSKRLLIKLGKIDTATSKIDSLEQLNKILE